MEGVEGYTIYGNNSMEVRQPIAITSEMMLHAGLQTLVAMQLRGQGYTPYFEPLTNRTVYR